MLKESNSNYPKLKVKLSSPKKCENEGLPFTDIARTFLDVGFEVCFPNEKLETGIRLAVWLSGLF
jgi:hypothetical protein